ncbi:methionine--tRNA ligase [Gilvimarinus agarilyticus]|uniref:Methionine--tRNA ligase n=1 Tax=Reichenbachiella agariperforans TaxID=156994 RepID=A0A1M6LW20_REIAG|nr:methionine--tRNA ligase [Reichenbachiella agariperforans]MBU2885548.1 methionine--tRNA ligase [Gilvimarinus agarilyticus]MBU2914072.1 methionine--tRNA ligase [Reichenbachiella agariperforans]SHJ75388.1 methionyl-tRNA synthetase [Reichenbachiella agariperforans]
MQKDYKRYTITSALPYANGPLHIGHIAGAYLPADIYVRFLRARGKEVTYVCGSDEHGAAITLRAKKEGTTPQAIIDKYHQINKDTFEKFGIDFDIYHRTSSPIHHETSQEFFTNLYDKGEFVEKQSEQFYDEEYNQFLADRYVTGTCPNCAYDAAYGDQCEKCGTSHNSTDLINPKSTLSGKTPILKSTKHWYLPLDKYQPWLERWLIEGKQGQWKPNVYGQCSSWLKAGLQPRAMTRDLDWGVDVPLPDAEGKKLYVWLDAPIGYISATKAWAAEKGKNWEDYWKTQKKKEDESCLIHFIGKDNIVFHCIIFPAILHAHGDYILPQNVPANEFLNLEGEKISTSRNWAVWLHEYLEDFPEKEDVLRYVLCSNAPESKDNDFTWKDFQARNNNELVAIYGNFVNRAVVLTHKYFDGKLPKLGALEAVDKEVLIELAEFPSRISESIDKFRFREALAHLMDLARLGNKYLAETEPWKLIKTNEKRTGSILNIALQIAANLSILSSPFLPRTSDKLSQMINLGDFTWADAGRSDLLFSGQNIEAASLLFEKIEDEAVEAQIDKLEKSKPVQQTVEDVEPQKAEAVFEDFLKMDMRVGTILEAQKVPKSSKLLQFKVDTGIDTRTILSGIAKHFTPEEMIGQQVTILANLAPRKIMGVESQGMILMAEDADGKLRLVQPNEKVQNGSQIS